MSIELTPSTSHSLFAAPLGHPSSHVEIAPSYTTPLEQHDDFSLFLFKCIDQFIDHLVELILKVVAFIQRHFSSHFKQSEVAERQELKQKVEDFHSFLVPEKSSRYDSLSDEPIEELKIPVEEVKSRFYSLSSKAQENIRIAIGQQLQEEISSPIVTEVIEESGTDTEISRKRLFLLMKAVSSYKIMLYGQELL